MLLTFLDVMLEFTYNIMGERLGRQPDKTKPTNKELKRRRMYLKGRFGAEGGGWGAGWKVNTSHPSIDANDPTADPKDPTGR